MRACACVSHDAWTHARMHTCTHACHAYNYYGIRLSAASSLTQARDGAKLRNMDGATRSTPTGALSTHAALRHEMGQAAQHRRLGARGDRPRARGVPRRVPHGRGGGARGAGGRERGGVGALVSTHGGTGEYSRGTFSTPAGTRPCLCRRSPAGRVLGVLTGTRSAQRRSVLGG